VAGAALADAARDDDPELADDALADDLALVDVRAGERPPRAPSVGVNPMPEPEMTEDDVMLDDADETAEETERGVAQLIAGGLLGAALGRGAGPAPEPRRGAAPPPAFSPRRAVARGRDELGSSPNGWSASCGRSAAW
jgi:hypothetical protein